jgi:cell division protein FtsX
MTYLYGLYERKLLTNFDIARDNLTTSAIPGSTVLLNAFLIRCKQISKIPSLNYKNAHINIYVRNDMKVNENERLSNSTLKHKIK